MAATFDVAHTHDFFDAHGQPCYADFGLSCLAQEPRLRQRVLSACDGEMPVELAEGVQGLIVLTPRITAHTVSRAEQLLAVGRFGVGYDNVDCAACTAADVLVFITAGAVDRSVAEATLTWMLALTHRVLVKDRLLREGRWHDRSLHMGSELRERTLGVIGLGGIGRALLELLAGFGMRPPLAFDPVLEPAAVLQAGARPVSLDELLSQGDFVSIHCPLNDSTRNLISARELALMQPGAYLINTARGGIVNEDALFAALTQGRIAGAALDCFVGEPITVPHRFATLDNVLLAPHSIAWTNELFRDIGRKVSQGMLDLAAGRRPAGVVNPAVLDKPSFQSKWARLRLG